MKKLGIAIIVVLIAITALLLYFLIYSFFNVYNQDKSASSSELNRANSQLQNCINNGRKITTENGIQVCLTYSLDAGNPCRDFKECESGCYAPFPNSTVGQCYPYKTFSGCWYKIDRARDQGIVCG